MHIKLSSFSRFQACSSMHHRNRNRSLCQRSYVISRLPNKGIERPIRHLPLCISPEGSYHPDALHILLPTSQRAGATVRVFIHEGNTEPRCAFTALKLNPSRWGSRRHQPLNVSAVQCVRWLVVHTVLSRAFQRLEMDS